MFINYAHRGASAYAPENTMAAFRLGVAMGADGIETDIRRTRDGVLRMIWSNFIKDSGYCVLQCASSSGSVRGPWKGHVPLFTRDGGHGMIFSRTDGTQLLTIHQPNTSPKERMRLFPIREAAAGFVCESGK